MNKFFPHLDLRLFMLACWSMAAMAQTPSPVRQITLDEAVSLAQTHDHALEIARLKTREARQTMDVVRSAYQPHLSNTSSVLRVTENEHIEIPANLFSAGTPAHSILLPQGGLTVETSGTEISQPLTPLLKVYQHGQAAKAEWKASGYEETQAEHLLTLKVHKLYFALSVAMLRQEAAHSAERAAAKLSEERGKQRQLGAALPLDELDSRAQTIQSQQDELTAAMAIDDLTVALDEVMGLPLGTRLAVSSEAVPVEAVCAIGDCIATALRSHPEVETARQQVLAAEAGVRLARRDYLPDTELFARHSYQNGIPFLLHNFGTFGFGLKYEFYDGGRRRSVLRGEELKLAQARENLARVEREVESNVRKAENARLLAEHRLQLAAAMQTVRAESLRVAGEQMARGEILPSQRSAAEAKSLDAEVSSLEARLAYREAVTAVSVAAGLKP